MSLINLGGGLSAMGSAVAQQAGTMGLAEQKSELEKEQTILADKLTGAREQANIAATGEQERQTGTSNAAAQGAQARETQEAANKLPMSAAQIAANEVGKTQAQASLEAARRPEPAGFGMGWLVRDGEGKWTVKNLDAGTGAPAAADPNSNNLPAQTGLSDLATKVLTGQTQGMRIGQGQSMMVEKEIDEWGRKNGINTTTMRAQAQAANKILEKNIERNNQGSILEQEIDGTIQNAAQVADDIGQGRVKMANIVRVWGGEQLNDPATIQAADQLARLRNEIASYNAVAGGHLKENGTPEPTPADFKEAEATISNGINSGGLKALQKSIAMSAAKNRNVLEDSIDSANESLYKLFGANYHRPDRTQEQSGASAAPAASGATSAAPAAASPKPAIPPWVKPGDQYSPSRNKARDAQGKEYGPPQ